jgi:MoaA/NifB/PqqE/SkfB family radical SAM enzyme
MNLGYDDLVRELEPLKHQLKYIKLCGTLGDPILYPQIQLIMLMQYLSDFPADIEVSTNGNPYLSFWWNELAQKVGPKINMIFCLDGLSTTYSLYRKGGSYHKVLNNMRAYIDGGGTASWKFIMIEHNMHEIDEAIQIATSLGCKYFIKVVSGVYNDELQKPKDLEITSYDTIRCQSLEDKSISIEADGEIMPCCGFKPIKSIINKDVAVTNNLNTLIAWGKDKKNLSIYTSTIKKAMETDFFKMIYNSYSTIHKCIFLCQKTRRDEKDFYERIEL